MMNTVDGLESSKTNVANDKTAKVDDQVQTENVKQEIGSPSKITTGHCDTLNTNAQEPNKNKNEISGQTMAGQTMPGHTVAGLTMPGQAMPDQTMPGQTMSGVTLPSQPMAGMTMAGQATLGYIDAAGVNNQWQQGMFMLPGMMPVPQLPPPPPGMFPPMNPWMPYYGMPYMMSPYYSNCPPGFSMNNQWQPSSNQWQPGINQWQPGNNQWQPGNNQWQPGNNQWQPGNNQWQPGNNQWQPGNNQWQQGSNQCQPNNNNLQPGNNQCQPTNNNWQPGNNPSNQYYGYQQQPGNTQQGYQVPCNQGNKPDYQQQQQHNHGNQQGHQQQQENPQDNQQQGQPIPPPRRRNNRQTTDNLPKGLRYDGTENWLGFKTKFTRHMEVKKWTNEESKDYLSLSLEGKASEYYATLVTRNEDIGFPDVLSKLEKRFGGVPLPDTAQTQLANLRQQPEESIEDWADRVVQLSVHAFPDLPEDYMYQQAVRRICYGCTDEEAAEYAVNMDLNSVQLVVDKIKSYQFNHQLIFDQGEQEMQEGQKPTDSSDSDDTECHSSGHQGHKTVKVIKMTCSLWS